MYAVIFRAEIKQLDDEYLAMAVRMRQLATDKYGCVDFTAVTEDHAEGKTEIAISYWENEAQIKQWKKDPEHLRAQRLGQAKWYKSYKIEIVEIKREYAL